MAVSLIKLVMTATTTTKAVPTVKRYFYKYASAQRSGVKIVIPSTSFVDDTGTAVASKLTPIVASNGYYLLFVDGALQESGLFTVGNTGSLVTILSGAPRQLSAPITLVVNNFAPVSTTTVTS